LRFFIVKEICIIHHPPMCASWMVLFFISCFFCSWSEFCHISLWYYGYNKYLLKIARSCAVCASLASPHPNLSYIIYILYKIHIDIKLNQPILVGVIHSITNTVPSLSFWWHPHHIAIWSITLLYEVKTLKIGTWKTHGIPMENPWNFITTIW